MDLAGNLAGDDQYFVPPDWAHVERGRRDRP